MMPINQISQIRYAVGVADLGSFSAAARACGVSQPTVSGAVVDLEAGLGMRLFTRSTRRVDITPAGERLIPLMRQVLQASQDVQAAVDALLAPPVPELRLGFSPLVGAARLGVLIEPFRSAHPEIKVVFQEAYWDDLDERLDRGAYDFIFGVGLREGRSRGRAAILADRLCYLRRRGAKAFADTIGIAEAAEDILLLTEDRCGLAPATRALFEARSVRVAEYAGKALSYNALEDWADLGIGGAIIPEPHIRDLGGAQLLVDDIGQTVTLASEAVWRRDLVVSAHARTFTRYLQKIVPAIVGGMAPQTAGGSYAPRPAR
jgi:LysR family transcriptional regulator, hydrogen peroxide-inducible genes activator